MLDLKKWIAKVTASISLLTTTVSSLGSLAYKSVLTDEIIVATVTLSNISITETNNSGVKSVSCARDGYTPICVCAFWTTNSASGGGNTSRCMIYYIALGGTGISFAIRNDAGSNAKVDAHFSVLYKKTA